MKVHLVVAHPEKESFNYALHQVALSTVLSNNYRVRETDLYLQEFNPAAGKGDVLNYPPDDYFRLAKAQRWALASNNFADCIKTEQDKLTSSDILILQFPMWWWSFPAILKGWIDRVLTSGFAYGEGAVLKSKKVMFSITTGGAGNQEERDYYASKIAGLYEDVFGFMGWEILPAFIAHGVQRISDNERKELLKHYAEHINKNVFALAG